MMKNITSKKKENSNIKSWTQIKDDVYGGKGSPRWDELERDVEAFKIGVMIRQARESKNMTQADLAELISKKRSIFPEQKTMVVT